MDEQAKLKTPQSATDANARLRLHIELFEIEENIARMEEARRQCIETWNRDIRAARKIARAKRNDIRSGAIQPELFDMLKGKSQT